MVEITGLDSATGVLEWIARLVLSPLDVLSTLPEHVIMMSIVAMMVMILFNGLYNEAKSGGGPN